jgi:hypothetical protein
MVGLSIYILHNYIIIIIIGVLPMVKAALNAVGEYQRL